MCPSCLNKTCHYCSRCELLIAHQDEVEKQLVVMLQEHQPELVGNDYLVMGTLDVEAWVRSRRTPLTIQKMRDNLHDFEAVLSIQPAGPSRPPRHRQRPGTSSSGKVASGRTPGRNDPCWCGSGKKYKSCHLGQESL